MQENNNFQPPNRSGGDVVMADSNQDSALNNQSKDETASNHQQIDQEMKVAAQNEEQVEEEVGTQPNADGFFADTADAEACSVRVAVRVRPLMGRELLERSTICVQVREEENQVIIGKDRSFNFDRCFGIESCQEAVYELCVKNLVLGCFVGFNATILAYGQTGAGKTFSMGSGFTQDVNEEDLGIIPRVIRFIFQEIEARQKKAEFIIKCSFLEIYNEELHDLLESGNSSMIDRIMPQKKEISIREEKNGTISVYGLKEVTVKSGEEMAECLNFGSSQRITASTMMNASSSRSHGIFTISIEQHMIDDLGGVENNQDEKRDEFMVAKFHFVDLAGSERAKKTGAVGATLKEGISINKGLLSLGNVISALTEESRKNAHVPYRDSKLTRILQDSLGGNSRTVMLACCSPAETNYEETLNTLKYANRARNIKNKPVVNRDPASQQIAQLRQQVYELQKELLGSRKLLMTNNIDFEAINELPPEAQIASLGKQIQANMAGMGLAAKPIGGGGSNVSNVEIKKMEQQISELKAQVSKQDKQILSMQSKYDALNDQHSHTQIQQFESQKDRDICRFQLESIIDVLKKNKLYEDVVKEINGGVMPDQTGTDAQIFDAAFGNSGPTVLEEYQLKVEEQTRELSNINLQVKSLQSDNQQLIEQSTRDTRSLEDKEMEITRMKRQNTQIMKEISDLKQDQRRQQQGKYAPVGRNTVAAPLPGVMKKVNSSANPKGKTIEQEEDDPFNSFAAAGQRDRSSTIRQRRGPRPTSVPEPQHWLSNDLEEKVKNFEEIRQNFINVLTNQMSNLMVAPQRERAATMMSKRPTNSLATIPENRNQSFSMDTDQSITIDPTIDEKLHEEMLSAIVEDSVNQEESKAGSDSNGSDIVDTSSDEEMPPINPTVAQAAIIDEKTEKIDKETKQEEIELQARESEVQMMDQDVKEKENILQMFKQSQRDIEGSLLTAMKEEYHMKIKEMNDELQRLEVEKGQTLQKSNSNAQKSKVEDQYKKKETELQNKLKELRQKELEQGKMSKNLNTQKLKVQNLEKEIDRMKTQKVTMMKKIKEETDNHGKLKKQRAQELTSLKKQLLKKDRENDKLKRDNRKKEIFAQRKQEELKAMHQRQKLDQKKKADATKVKQKSKQIDTSKIKDWILDNTAKMVEYHQLQVEKGKEDNQCREIETKISEEQRQYARLSVQVEKLMQRKNQLSMADEGTQDDEIFQTETEMQDLSQQMENIQDHIDSLEEKQSFYAGKITDLSKQLISVRPTNTDSMVFNDVQTLDGARACIGTFFQILLDLELQIQDVISDLELKESTVVAINAEITEIQREIELKDVKFKRDIEQCQTNQVEKERMLVQLIVEKAGIDIEQIQILSTPMEQSPGSGDQQKEISIVDLVDHLLKMSRAKMDGGSVLSQHEREMLNKSNFNAIKKGVNAKAEIREGKQEKMKETKAAISKKNTELEKKVQECEVLIQRLKNALHTEKVDKAKFKRYYENELAKEKKLDLDRSQSINTKFALQPILQTQKSATGMQIHPSILQATKAVNQTMQSLKMTDLKEQRNQRKLQKQTSTTSQSQLMVPGVIRNLPNSPQIKKQTTRVSAGNEVLMESPRAVSPRGEEINPLSQSVKDRDVFKRLAGNRVRSVTNPLKANFNSVSHLHIRNNSDFSLEDKAISNGSEIQKVTDQGHWEMAFDKQDAHKSRINCMTAVGNQLYSTADKSLKIWDIETMKYVSDLPERIGLVKAIAYFKEKNLLITASEKTIMLWDVVSLTNVGYMKGYKEEIKALQLVPGSELLFAASKGTATSSGLMVYDLRKSSLLYEREKNQDIFSLAATDQHVFYGCRNHTVNPFCLSTYNTLPTLQPPHFDVVTSLAMLGGGRTLVSGSRDKNLRCYDLTSPNFEHVGAVMTAHTDQINTLATDSTQTNLYSGGRDGIVKIWNLQTVSDPYAQIQPQELQCMASLEGNATRSPVNTICRLDNDPTQKSFACGSNDKSIRIWKQTQGDDPFKQAEFDCMDQKSPTLYTPDQQVQLDQLQMMQNQNSKQNEESITDSTLADSSNVLQSLRLRKKKKQIQEKQQQMSSSMMSSEHSMQDPHMQQ